MSNEYLYKEQYKLNYNFEVFLKGLGLSLIFFILAILFRFLMKKLVNCNSKFEKLYSSKYSLIILTIIILVFWAPILIGMFPRNFNK